MSWEANFTELGGVEPVRGDKLVPMPEEEIGRLERQLNIRLPEAYRRFLATYGSSAFGRDVVFRPARDLPKQLARRGRGLFGFFYGGEHDDLYSLARTVRVFSGRMPESIIPIGGDGGGNQICLGINGTERGKVYYWDHENEWDEEDYLEDYGEPMPPEVKFQNLHLVAESFEDFLNRLEVADPNSQS